MTDEPWWISRCVHRDHAYQVEGGLEYGCWRVLLEVEHVVFLHLTCLNVVHFVVDLPGVGSSCRVMSRKEYHELTDQDKMRLVQAKVKDLQSIRAQY